MRKRVYSMFNFVKILLIEIVKEKYYRLVCTIHWKENVLVVLIALFVACWYLLYQSFSHPSQAPFIIY